MNHCGTKNIETDRLMLRRFLKEDAEAVFHNWTSDPEVTKYLTWPTHGNKEITERIVSEWVDSYENDSFYQWAIIVKENGDYPIGCISVINLNEKTSLAHIGYCIGRAWWNQGIATEAMKAVMEYLFRDVNVSRIEARFDPCNAGSGAVMKKCGMTYEGTLRGADWNNQGICDASYYAILKSEWFLSNFQLTKEEISVIIEDALAGYLKVVSKEGNRPFVHNEKIGWVKTFPTAWSNYIFYFNESEEQAENAITRVIQNIKNHEMPDEWMIGPKSNPSDLCKRLEQRGFQKRYELTGMAIDLLQTDLTIVIPENVNIAEVETIAQMETWAVMISKGLWHGDTFEAGLFTNLIDSPNYKFYLAYLNGEPVAASMLQLSNGIAAMDLICTLEEHWRKGIGNAMTKIPLLHARNQGYRIGVLQASKAGDPGYRKIGFQEYCRFYVYKYTDTAKQ